MTSTPQVVESTQCLATGPVHTLVILVLGGREVVLGVPIQVTVAGTVCWYDPQADSHIVTSTPQIVENVQRCAVVPIHLLELLVTRVTTVVIVDLVIEVIVVGTAEDVIGWGVMGGKNEFDRQGVVVNGVPHGPH